MKNPWIIILVLAVVLIGGSVWYSDSVSATNNEGVEAEVMLKGNPEGVVTLVEYSDLQCPACSAFQPYVNEVLAAYGDDIRFEYKHFPLPIHPLAEPAARAAEAAGQQDKFFEYADVLFEKQSAWSTSPNPAGLFITYATDLGLDVDMFKRHMNASVLRDKIRADAKEARDRGVTGTPTFFLNGERMQITSYEDFRSQIESVLNPQVDFTLPTEEPS
jgi:protein-disulfide isomerase